MNSFTLNGTAINGSGSLASVVFLPSATASVELALNERIAVSMSGELGISLTASGDISRVSNLGSAPTEITFLAAGDLTRNRQIYLGEALTGFDVSASGALTRVILGPPGISEWGMSLSGTLAKVNLGPPGTSEWGMALSGDLQRNVYLVGTATHQFDLGGSLSAKRLLGEASAAFFLDAVGGMSLIGGMSGTADIALIPAGNLTQGLMVSLPSSSIAWGRGFTGTLRSTQMMAGTVTSHTDLVGAVSRLVAITGDVQVGLGLMGSLSNNSGGYDLVHLTMVRPYINREMKR
jgi:hypothetical protein